MHVYVTRGQAGAYGRWAGSSAPAGCQGVRGAGSVGAVMAVGGAVQGRWRVRV
jgi:hypothetical protein